jgi:hypothetical protein
VGKHLDKRKVKYERVDKDYYATPEWVTSLGLLSHVNVRNLSIWEPAAGAGDMAEPLKAAGAQVFCSDIEDRGYPLDAHIDFTSPRSESFTLNRKIDAVITNPPFSYAMSFIQSGLDYIRKDGGFLALLLPMDFHQRSPRRELFFKCPEFAAHITITERITWFRHSDDDRPPMENHAWFVWDSRKRSGAPQLLSSPGDDFYRLPRTRQLEIIKCVAKSFGTLKPEAKPSSETEVNKQAPAP